MKTIITVLTSLLLVMSTAAIAQNYPPTRTYEVLVQSVRLPNDANGTITVKECKDCDYETYRVTGKTIYAIDGINMRLDKFRPIVERLRHEGKYVVNVRRDIQSNTIAKVFIYTK